jgi:cell shape-determining protein MreD
MINNAKLINTLKHVTYCVIFIVLYILQSTPGMLMIAGVKPVLLIPAAITLAMLEGEFVGGCYGAFAGLLCDIGGALIFGFNGFLTFLCCVGVGLLIIYLMRSTWVTCLLFVAVFMLIRGGLEFLFDFGMWGYEGAGEVFLSKALPSAIYSTLTAPLLFWLFGKIGKGFEAAMNR